MGLRSLLLSWAFLLAAMLAGGCSKNESAPGANKGPSAERGPGPLVNPPVAGAIADSGDINATLNQLSLELRRYVVGTRTVPKDFEDFVAKSHVQAPPPPAGKKYAIKDQAVVLVKR